MKKVLVLSLFLMRLAMADSLLPDGATDPYSPRPLMVGELVTVVVSDHVSTSQKVDLESDSSNDVSLPLGKGLLSLFLGGGMTSSGKSQRQEAASTTSDFQNTVTARVVEILPGSVVVLEANSSVEIDGKTRELHLTGKVRRQDIPFNNRIGSEVLADARVTVDGAQASPNGAGLGIFDFLLAPFR